LPDSYVNLPQAVQAALDGKAEMDKLEKLAVTRIGLRESIPRDIDVLISSDDDLDFGLDSQLPKALKLFRAYPRSIK